MERIIVGRDPDPAEARIILSDKSVSRSHAAISPFDAGYLVEDLNSANGTYLKVADSWQRIERQVVERDATIRMGSVVTTLRALMEHTIHMARPPRLERNPETGEIVYSRKDKNHAR